MFVKVARSELESACGASVVRRDADDIYLPREMIEAAMAGTEPEFLAVRRFLLSCLSKLSSYMYNNCCLQFGLTLILVGEDVVDTSPEDSEEPEDSGDEEVACPRQFDAWFSLMLRACVAERRDVVVFGQHGNDRHGGRLRHGGSHRGWHCGGGAAHQEEVSGNSHLFSPTHLRLIL